MTPNSLNSSIHLATIAHAGQLDKAGLPYILHPLRVMLAVVKKYPKDTEAAMAAVLHDVVEDTDWVTLDYLRTNGYTDRTVNLIDVLSRRKAAGETYDQFIDRIQVYGAMIDYTVIQIKLEDIDDNINRIAHLSESEQWNLVCKYTKARAVLLK